MNSVTGFDEDKFFIGSLCKREHRWNGTDRSLRNKNKGECLECKQFLNQERLIREKAERANKAPKLRVRDMVPQISLELMELLDTSKYFLGSPCSRNHSWNGTWYCLRFKVKSSGSCVECRKEYEQTAEFKA